MTSLNRFMIIYCMIAPILVLCYPPASVRADDPAARQIMQQVEDRDDGDNRTSDMRMVLIDKNDHQREKIFKTFTKDYGKDTRQILFVEKPANIRDTGFLTYDWDDPDKDDDQWLYLPALGKPKRIASRDKDGSFMGSDLNYSDMTSRNLKDYDFTLLKETTFKGEPCWIIQSVPRSDEVIDETGYIKSILAVRKDNYMVSRVKAWTDTGGYVKIMDFDDMTVLDGIWIARRIHVVKRLGKETVHQTWMMISNIRFNQELGDDLFTLRRLTKGL